MGLGCFEWIGIFVVMFFVDLDGVVEIVCGILVFFGLLIWVVVVLLFIDMVGVIVLIKF